MNYPKVDISAYQNTLGFKNKLFRFLWNLTWLIFARPIPRRMLNGWKIGLLRIFGAQIHKSAVVYSSAKIYMPRNLKMDAFSVLGADVDCYNVDRIHIGANTVVSQKAFLCTASHDITDSAMPLITAPIRISDQVWIAANSFVGMGVTIGSGAVVGACSAVYKDVDPWTVVGGNPAVILKKRKITS